jgi:YHS domain-containing protein
MNAWRLWPARRAQKEAIMADELNSLEREIENRLKTAEERRQMEKRHIATEMAAIERRHEAFSRSAGRLTSAVIRPRVERLAKFFDNAQFSDEEDPGGHRCVCRFNHAERFPATVKLAFSVAHDDEVRNIIVSRDLEILPIFFRFSPHEKLAFPLDRVDEPQLAAWVEQQIVAFVETYLQLEQSDQYQQETLVTDPVCGMRIRKSLAAAKQEYRGVTYHFCTEKCRELFVDAPDQYVGGGQAPTA